MRLRRLDDSCLENFQELVGRCFGIPNARFLFRPFHTHSMPMSYLGHRVRSCKRVASIFTPEAMF
jgi:hypothetical protein